MLTRRKLIQFITLPGLPTLAGSIHAQQPWPSRPVRIIVGYQAGGPTDAVARLLADKLQQVFGQPFIVDNRPGVGSNMASEAVASAAPDGYTLLVAAAPLTMNRYVYKNQRFDAESSFVPISKISSAPGVLAVSPKLPVKDLAQLIALAKSRPGELTYGSTGIGGTQHMAGERLQVLTGIKLVHVPYKGASAVLPDLMAGNLDMAFMTSTGSMAFLESQKVKPIAVAGPRRLRGIPDVPTFGEVGQPQMVSDSWNGLLAPAATPAAIVQKLHEAVNEFVKMPETREKLESQGAVMVGSSPSNFRKDLRSEGEHWKQQFASIKIETQ